MNSKDEGHGNDSNTDKYTNTNYLDTNYKPKAYVFDGKVVFGLGVIFVAAAASTIAAMNASMSPQINLSQAWVHILGGARNPTVDTTVLGQKQQQQHIDKRFVLVQHDFGWNGTSGGPTITVNKGDVVQIVVINAGQMAHNFGMGQPSKYAMTIMKDTKNLSLPDRMKHIPYNVMAELPCPGCQPKFEEGHIKTFMRPDTQQVTTFKATEPGNFKYFCMVRGHIWLGMVGDLVVLDNNRDNATTTSQPT
ncbi:MAG: hypothetical protein M3Y53_07345 [Thermoproteota archaeon]|nr:hypothetical protein [Thermoproteota archaeon]